MPGRIEIFIRNVGNKLTRSRISMKLFGLRKSEHVPRKKGLIIIQIDALSRKQLENAIHSGRVPFIKNLLNKQYYQLHSHYSGMPCSTAAVQAELLYGVKAAVPAFSFYDNRTKRVFIMFNPVDASEVEHRLRHKGKPLLEGGSAYSDIYTGGAEESHYCISSLKIRKILRPKHILGFIIMSLMHFYSLVRTIILFVIEIFLAVSDFFRGLIKGQDLGKELKFIPSRVAMCVLLREFIVIQTKIDIARGMPVIHMNFMGYHEQSHRRGATSRFAHWTLRGIDYSIKRVWLAAHKSVAREYDIWIYSDHGQIDSTPYQKKFGKTIQLVVEETFDEIKFSNSKNPGQKKIGFLARTGLRKSRFFAGIFPSHPLPEDNNPVISALGPIGHIYLRNSIVSKDIASLRQLALGLIKHTHVPMVFITNKNNPEKNVEVWTEEGHFLLPDQAGKIFDTASPFYQEMVRDFIYSCHQENCGDLIICGWQKRTGKCVTFAIESGSHGGITTEESEGFAVLPGQTPLKNSEKGYIRPLDLRNAAFQLVQSSTTKDQSPVKTSTQNLERTTIRVMTYNVHGCMGMDGRISPRRIADCISQYEPDIVALQELDVGRTRSGKVDQALIIAEYLNMEHHFHATIQVEEESFGDAILSVFPIELIKKEELSRYENFLSLEPRGALWVKVAFQNIPIHVFNTHLGLNSKERFLHTRELLEKKWIKSPECKGAVILCGDFNSMPFSKVFKLLQENLISVQANSEKSGSLRNTRSHKRTWFGRYPLASLDHIFVSSDFEVVNIEAGDSYLARLASDHRPIIADLKIKSA